MEEKEISRREYRRKRRKKNQIIAYVVIVFLFLLLAGGIFFAIKAGTDHVKAKREEEARIEAEMQAAEEQALLEQQEAEEASSVEEVLEEEDLLEELIGTYIADMTLEEKVAGLFVVTPEAITGVQTAVKAGDGTKEALEKYPVGGFIYFAKNIKSEEQLKEMISNTNSYSKYPLFISVDEEGGKVSRLGGANLGIENVGSMAEIGATNDASKAEEAGKTIGGYLAEYGFNVDFAPVGDVLTKEGNPIGDRSFSSDAAVVSQMVSSFVNGMQSTGTSACVKHFPGHGNTEADSHDGMASTDKTIEEMRETEFLPFKAGIEQGVDFIMVGHITAPNVIGDETPSNLSSMMVTEVLRNELGFNGIAITDAMNMKAITDKYAADEAAILAIQAGIDMILMPEDFEVAYNGVLEAVKTGKLSEDRINESIGRIYRVKYKDALEE